VEYVDRRPRRSGGWPLFFFETSLIAFACEAHFPYAQRDTPNM